MILQRPVILICSVRGLCKVRGPQSGLIVLIETLSQFFTQGTQKCTKLVYESSLKKRKTDVVFIDIIKAFDRVWRDAVIYKLIIRNTPPKLILLFWNYLKCKTFSIRVNNYISSSRTIEAGVLQGSLICTWLFHIYIKDIPKNSRILITLLYTAFHCTF